MNKLGIKAAVFHLLWLKPFRPNELLLESIRNSKHGFLILDDDYVDGIAKNLAFDLMALTGKSGIVMGLKDKTAGFPKHLDNLPPSAEEIVEKITHICV